MTHAPAPQGRREARRGGGQGMQTRAQDTDCGACRMPVATGNETRAETVAAFAEEARGRNWTRKCARRQRRAQVLRGLCLLGTVLVLRAPEAAGYLLKSHMYWERIGAHPHYVNTPVQAENASSWPYSSHCFNGPACGKHTPDFRCNPKCGEPSLGQTDPSKWPKPFLIRFVIDVVVDVRLWFEQFKIDPPMVDTVVRVGTFCRDLSMPLNLPDNCETELPFWVMHITEDRDLKALFPDFAGYAHLRHTSMWDYGKEVEINAGVKFPPMGRDPASDYVLHNYPPDYLSVPFNLTVGFNFTTGRSGYRDRLGALVPEYRRCPFTPVDSSGNAFETFTVNPACYCTTARCKQEDEQSGSFHGPWTATSVVTFFSDIYAFKMGVTPNTQNHAPRIYAPHILYVPLLEQSEMGANFSMGKIVGGEDEDGETILEWSTGQGSVFAVDEHGQMLMKPLATENCANPNCLRTPWPDLIAADQGGHKQFYKFWIWKVRLQAVDKATDPWVTTDMQFSAKLCFATVGTFVPIWHYSNPETLVSEGIKIKALGQAQTIYLYDWGPSCVHNATRQRLANINHTQAVCLAVGGEWMSGEHFYTKPDTLIECHVDQPCEFEVHSARLDFEKAGVLSCKWSNQVLNAGEKYCHDLTIPGIEVTHDAFPVTFTGEHEVGPNDNKNPGKMVVKPFQGRSWSKVPYSFDIGRREVFCISSKSNDTLVHCPSLPHCVTVLVKGRAPVITSPESSPTCNHRTKADASEFLQGECPDLYSCWRSDTVSEVTLSATDADVGETVTIVVDSISTHTRYSDQLHHLTQIAYPNIQDSANGGVDINEHCRDRQKDPTESPASRFIPVDSMSAEVGGGGTPPLATVVSWQAHKCGSVLRKVTFKTDYVDNGMSALETRITALGHRYTATKNDSIICYSVSDNQAEVWGRGVNNKYSRCHVLRLRGAPVFLYSPQYPLDTPFAGTDERDIGLTQTTLTARLAEPVSFTFRARDPNPEDPVKVMFLQDPGIPNDARLGDQVCVDYGAISNFVSDGVNEIPRTYTECSGQFKPRRLTCNGQCSCDSSGTPSCSGPGICFCDPAPYCNSIPSPCNEAHRTFSWIPTPGSEGQIFKVCAIAKDDKSWCGSRHTRRADACWPLPQPPAPLDLPDAPSDWTPTQQFLDTCVEPSLLGSSKRSTLTGFYGNEHCVEISVIGAQARWDTGTVPTEAGINKVAHVGCDIVWKISATDVNNHTMRVEVDADTPLPEGAEMVTIKSGVTTHKELRWTPRRGMEGSFYTICWRAWVVNFYPSELSTAEMVSEVRNVDGTMELPKRCVHVKVRRCKYCVRSEDTLLVKMKEYSVDMNWRRLWAANGNDDGDELTTEIQDPGLLGTGTCFGSFSAHRLSP